MPVFREFDDHDFIRATPPATPAYPESGDYVVGRYEVSARVTDDRDLTATEYPGGALGSVHTPVVIVSSAKAPRTFLTATPADARGMATALRVAADQADQDAGVAIVQDSTPEWLKALAVSVYASRTSELAALRAELEAVTDEYGALRTMLIDEGYNIQLPELGTVASERLDPPVTQVLKTEITRLTAELDTVTAERDNALAELATLPDEGWKEIHGPTDPLPDSVEAKLEAVTAERDNALAEAEAATHGREDLRAVLVGEGYTAYAATPPSAAELDAMRAELGAKAPDAPDYHVDPTKAPTGPRAEYIERLRAEQKCTCEYPYEVTGLGHHPGCELSN